MRTPNLFSPPPGLGESSRRERRRMLARTGLAWLVMMQVMMLAFPGYMRPVERSAEAQQTLEQAIVLMNWSSLVLCVPLMTYCAWPLWQGAWRDLARRRVGMDVPVALGLLAAFIPSVIATWRQTGEVYFDSVSMFVAFLMGARYLELCARQAAGSRSAGGLEGHLLALADRWALRFVCVQLVLAAGVGLWWWSVQPDQAVAVTVALLVMSCPCALSMSVPAALAARRTLSLRHDRSSALDAQRLDAAMRRVARQNLFGSLAWHVLVTPLAAMGWVQPWLAALTMLMSSLAVAVNAWRLTRIQGPSGLGLVGSTG